VFEPFEDAIDDPREHLLLAEAIAAKQRSELAKETSERRRVKPVALILAHGEHLERAHPPVEADAHAHIERRQIFVVVEQRSETAKTFARAHLGAEIAEPREAARCALERITESIDGGFDRAEDVEATSARVEAARERRRFEQRAKMMESDVHALEIGAQRVGT